MNDPWDNIDGMKRAAKVGDMPADTVAEGAEELEVVNPDDPVILDPLVVTADRVYDIPPFVWFAGGFALGLYVAHKLRN